MTDGVPKQTGNSRYLKSAIDSDITFEQFRDMLRNGTLPIDLNGINPDGWAELGTPLNKASLLSDEPLKRIGLSTSSVPTDMFNVLSKVGDLHVWRRTIQGKVDYPVSTNRNAYTEGTSAGTTIEYLGNLGEGRRFQFGTYVGTGVYDDSHKNYLNFSFDPKVIFIGSSDDNSYAQGGFPWFYGNDFGKVYSPSDSIALNGCYIEWMSKALKWYSDDSAGNQLNVLGITYYYMAIG